MDFGLSDDHQLLRETVRNFAEKEIAPVAEELDRTKSFPYEIIEQIGELGWMGIAFPEQYGGGGSDGARAMYAGFVPLRWGRGLCVSRYRRIVYSLCCVCVEMKHAQV